MIRSESAERSHPVFTRQLIKGLSGCAAFIALGVFALHSGAALVGWITIATFGGLVVLVALGAIYRAWRGKPDRVVLRDGRHYSVQVAEENLLLKNKLTGEEKLLRWADLTSVYVVAIDAFPVGTISFMLHRGSEITEIPTDAEGNAALLARMQEVLAGFDNRALIEAMGMLHGFRQIWARRSEEAAS